MAEQHTPPLRRRLINWEINVWNLIGGVIAVVCFIFFIGQQFNKYQDLPSDVKAIAATVAKLQSDIGVQRIIEDSRDKRVNERLDDLGVRVKELEKNSHQ